ncbi:MAG: hypothetical protein AABX29_07145 [Nanoarchaeota archaeon]
MNKKAQIEIMGLMVIVLILVFVILIALKFFLVPKTNTEEIQRQSIQASSMLNAILRSNTEDGSTVTKKIVECYNSAGDLERCKFMDICPSTGPGCQSPNLEKDILRKAFLKKKYKLAFKAQNDLILMPHGQNCLPDEASITGSATVSVSPPIIAKITVCVLPQESI